MEFKISFYYLVNHLKVALLPVSMLQRHTISLNRVDYC